MLFTAILLWVYRLFYVNGQIDFKLKLYQLENFYERILKGALKGIDLLISIGTFILL